MPKKRLSEIEELLELLARRRKMPRKRPGGTQNKLKRAARRAVWRAKRDGLLFLPECHQCICGKAADGYHHHKGYAFENWLDVMPMCRECHEREERILHERSGERLCEQ